MNPMYAFLYLGLWKNQFSKSMTRKMSFFVSAKEQVDAEFMFQVEGENIVGVEYGIIV